MFYVVLYISDNFELQCRVLNKPYDIFGTWYNNSYLLSGNLHWIGHLASCSALWLNYVSSGIVWKLVSSKAQGHEDF